MVGKGVDIRNQLNLSGAGRSTANTTRKRDGQTPVPALIRPDLEQFWPDHAIKACPVKPIVRMVHLAGHGGHKANRVGFTAGQRGDGFLKRRVVGHVMSVGAIPHTSANFLDALNGQSRALTAANANCGYTAFQTALFQRVKKRDDDPCPGRADGVTHVIAEKVEDISAMLDTLLEPASD